MDVRLLGPLELRLHGQEVPLGSPQQVAVLALLALAEGRPVPIDTLVDALWGDQPPTTAVNVVQTYVARLRRTLGRDAVRTVPGGYLLTGADVDAVRFQQAVARASAPEALREALDLWRGPLLPECSDVPGLRARAARLEELRWTVTEDWLEGEIAAGAAGDLVPELTGLVAAHPLRERMRVALATALYRAGRRPEALRVCASGRRLLRDALGLDPGPALRAVEQAILREEPALSAPARTGARRAPAPEVVLPRFLTSYVGRRQEGAEVLERLGRTRLLTLTGPGGIGKTRLAVDAAAAVAGAYDGVRFVDLQSLPPQGDVAGAVALAVGLVRREPAPAAALTAFVAARRLLLVLDNCEHVVDTCAALVQELLSGLPALRVLATSREPLRIPGEVVWSVPPMGVEPTGALEDGDAVELLRARAEEARPGSTTAVAPAVLSDLCRQLEGLPLALELAAARIRVMEVGELVERLGRERSLTWAGSRSGPERHRSLQAAVAWSLDLLSVREREALASLSVFQGSFSLDAAEAVVGGDDAAAVVGALVDRSLLTRERAERTRYRLLAPVRESSAGILTGAAADAARMRHLHHHAALATTASALHTPATVPTLGVLDAASTEIWAAVEWGLTADPCTAVAMTADLWWYAFLRGPLAETRARQARALAACPPERPDLRGGVLRGVAAVALAEGDFSAVTSADVELLRLAAELGSAELEALGHAGLGQAAWAQGRYDDAVRDLCTSASTARRIGAAWIEAVETAVLARVHGDRGDRRTALRTARTAVAVADGLGEAMARAFAADVLAELLLEDGDVEGAEEHGARALQLYREVGYREGEASALQRQADIALSRGASLVATAACTDALAVARALGHPGAMAQAMESLARAVAARDAESAALLLGAGSALRAATGAAPSPSSAQHRELTQQLLRDVLGEDGFAATWEAGRRMRPGRALDLARRLVDGATQVG